MRKLSLFIYVIIAAQLILLQSCSKKDSSSSSSTSASYKITGKITGNGISSRSSLVTSSTSSPDKIVAMYNHGRSSKEFAIQSDGSFEVDTSLLNKDDLVVFVVNSTSKTIAVSWKIYKRYPEVTIRCPYSQIIGGIQLHSLG